MNISLLLHISSFIFIIFIGVYNWIYFLQTKKAEKEIGFALPNKIKLLLNISILLPIATIIILLFFIPIMNISFFIH